MRHTLLCAAGAVVLALNADRGFAQTGSGSPEGAPRTLSPAATGAGTSASGPGAPASRPSPASGGAGDRICPQDAKRCPDGSFVRRTGPNCEFAPCP